VTAVECSCYQLRCYDVAGLSEGVTTKKLTVGPASVCVRCARRGLLLSVDCGAPPAAGPDVRLPSPPAGASSLPRPLRRHASRPMRRLFAKKKNTTIYP